MLNQIKKLYCGTLDPNPKINGRGIKLLKKAGIEISVGLLKDKCKELNRIFFTNQRKSRPYIILKSAQSLDGKIIGSVTAGAWSPFLETGIAIVQLNCDLENVSEAKLKNSGGIHDVMICDLPFHDKEKNIPTG